MSRPFFVGVALCVVSFVFVGEVSARNSHRTARYIEQAPTIKVHVVNGTAKVVGKTRGKFKAKVPLKNPSPRCRIKIMKLTYEDGQRVWSIRKGRQDPRCETQYPSFRASRQALAKAMDACRRNVGKKRKRAKLNVQDALVYDVKVCVKKPKNYRKPKRGPAPFVGCRENQRKVTYDIPVTCIVPPTLRTGGHQGGTMVPTPKKPIKPTRRTNVL